MRGWALGPSTTPLPIVTQAAMATVRGARAESRLNILELPLAYGLITLLYGTIKVLEQHKLTHKQGINKCGVD